MKKKLSFAIPLALLKKKKDVNEFIISVCIIITGLLCQILRSLSRLLEASRCYCYSNILLYKLVII
jgi:hypothetical protein